MLGMCVLTSGGDPATYSDVLARATASTPLALALLARLGEQLGCEPTQRGGQRRAPRAAARGCDRLPAGAVARRAHRGPGRRRGLSAADHPGRRARARGRRPRPPRRAHRAVDRRGARAARAATTSWRTRSSARLEAAAAEGAVAFKSVIAYRTGLDIAQPERRRCARRRSRAGAQDGFRETRGHAKPVRDRLLERTLEVASATGVPVHIHSGGGDPDSLVPHARPAGLFDLLKRHPQQPVLLIHAGWPWTDEAAFMASILPHVYLDLSIGIPWALARDRPADRDRARRRAAVEGALRLRRGQRARGRVVRGARRPRGARARARRPPSSAAGSRRRRQPASATDVLAGNCRRLHGIAA